MADHADSSSPFAALLPALARVEWARRFWQPLFSDPAIIAHFKPHAGKTIAVTLPGSTLLYHIGSEGHFTILSRDEGSSEPDLYLVFSWTAVQALLTGDPSWRSLIHQDGDAALAEDFLPLWDSAPTLARQWVSDALPEPMADLAQRGVQHIRSTWSDLSDRLRLQKDDTVARFAVTRQELDNTALLLQRMAKRAETLEARIVALESSLQSTPPTSTSNNTQK